MYSITGGCRDVRVECIFELALLVSEGFIDPLQVQALTRSVRSM
jgi:hypothetical protein